MITGTITEALLADLSTLSDQGVLKREHPISSTQGPRVRFQDREIINLCSNNYLGLGSDPRIIAASAEGMERWGYGLASVRFICGTQESHLALESKLATFFDMEAAILYSSCFDANGGLFEILTSEQDAIISDSLNHASIIDGIRLSKAKRFRYPNADMSALRKCLEEATSGGARRVLIATDGVFSMDGTVADLSSVCDLADEFHAMVMVDDSHASGFLGRRGRGSVEHCGAIGRVDIITSTLGKALGGASGGFTCATKTIIELLRQKSRPYLFSNSLAPAVVAGSIKAIDILTEDNSLGKTLMENTAYYRRRLGEVGLTVKGEIHPIVPIMIGDERLAYQVADALFDAGLFVVGIAYPVVPKGEARIRTQVSAAHSRKDLDEAIALIEKICRTFGLIS